MEQTQVVSAVLGVVVPIVLTVVGATWFLATRFALIDQRFAQLDLSFARIDQRLGQLHSDLLSVQSPLGAHSQVLAIFAGSLQRLGGLTPEDVKSITQLASTSLGVQAGEVINRAARGNPITRAEADRLHRYVAMAQAGELFTEDEVRDFYTLSNRVAQEEPTDPGAWALVTLGAFLLGLYLGSKPRQA